MNDAIAAIALGRRIDLTREADFIVGGARIRPTACEVEVAGRRIRLQPRVMQVLVALARAGGEPVSREALIEVCWGSVTVGEDALNRCIQRLRRLAESEVAGAFAIETIPRIGYRLAAGPQANDEDGPENAPVAVDGADSPTRRGGGRLGVWIACGILGVMIAAAAGWMWTIRPAQWSIERSEALVRTPLLEGSPALSADGTTLAYSAGPDDTGRHIWLKRLSGGESIQLTDDAYDDDAPAWSPDGAQIAYTADRKGEPCRIMVAPVPAGLAREVGRCVTTEKSRAVWAPAGDALFLVDAVTVSASEQIMSLNLATGRRRAITHPPGGFDDEEPAVSPDGRWLLFFRTSLLPEQMTIHDLKTGQERVLARFPQEHNGAAWAEDSRSIFYVGETAQGFSIWSYPIDGSRRSDLIGIGSPMGLNHLATGRGGLLAAQIDTGRWDVVGPSRPDGLLDVVDPAKSATWSPAFAPDGTLAMASTRSGGAGIWLKRPGEQARMLLGLDHEIPLGLTWSPDAAELAYVTLDNLNVTPGPHNDLNVIGVAGDTRARIPLPGTAVGEPAWTNDGHALVVPLRDRGGWRLWQAALARPKAPYPVTGYGWVAVRRGGDALYGVRSHQPGVWRLGPTPRKITPAFSATNHNAWTVFHGEIVFADGDDPAHRRLLAVPESGGPPRPFADVPRQVEEDVQFAIDPRSGEPVFIAALDIDSDIELFHLTRR